MPDSPDSLQNKTGGQGRRFIFGCNNPLVRIVSPLQGWTVIVALVVPGFVSRCRRPPQAGLVGVLLIKHFVAVFKRRQPCLSIIKPPRWPHKPRVSLPKHSAAVPPPSAGVSP